MLSDSNFISTTNQSPNTIQPFPINSNHNESIHFKNQKNYKSETSNFLKAHISTMIKDEMKSYRLQKKLERQLKEYEKNKSKKQLIQDLHRIDKYRQTQSQMFKVKFENYIKEKQRKTSRIKETFNNKKKLLEQKKLQNNQRIEEVKQRFYESQNIDINNRLSRADSVGSQRSSRIKNGNLFTNSRCISTSHHNRNFIKPKTQGQEDKKITTYFKKMKNAQTRILSKQLQNEQRKQKSIRAQIINYTKERNMKEQMKAKALQEKYDSKMQTFHEKLNKFRFEHESQMMGKSMMKNQIRDRVVKNKQINENELINKTIANFMKKYSNKQNFNETNKKRMDQLRTKSSFMGNTIKLHKQSLNKQNQKNLRILYEKLNRIKNMKQTQTIPQKQRDYLISLLDNEDIQYQEMIEFLTNSKSQFIRKKIDKQEERAKTQKIKKTTRFNSKN